MLSTREKEKADVYERQEDVVLTNEEREKQIFPCNKIPEELQEEMERLRVKYENKRAKGDSSAAKKKEALLFLNTELYTEKSYQECVDATKKKFPDSYYGFFRPTCTGIEKLFKALEEEGRKCSGLPSYKFK